MKRVAKSLLMLGACSAAFLLGQSTANIDKWWTPENEALAAAPKNHKLLFENAEVRVLEVTVPPGVREPLHAHRYPSVLYYVSAAHLKEYLARRAGRRSWPEGGWGRHLSAGRPSASDGESGEQQTLEGHSAWS